ncbi:hypothetical protein NDU88_000675 [Pleurodeles waltl]|uniref:Uncharacterized protein n=1 Tax=Pleurodeles waltl TaxID=8319 RepID=A0AAV7LX06_PLEWA|nr:hypothetical protein NDU88_000675 [Pleurodeles waltl]
MADRPATVLTRNSQRGSHRPVAHTGTGEAGGPHGNGPSRQKRPRYVARSSGFLQLPCGFNRLIAHKWLSNTAYGVCSTRSSQIQERCSPGSRHSALMKHLANHAMGDCIKKGKYAF